MNLTNKLNRFLLILLCGLFLQISYAAAQSRVLSMCGASATTLPSRGDYGSFGTINYTRRTLTHTDSRVPDVVSVYIPENASASNKVPVIFFAHGFGGTNYLHYENLLKQLASNGYAVVFAPYTSTIFVTHADRYNQMSQGFALAVQNFGAVFDTSRVGYVGHSYGAGATPELARRGVASGWGTNGLFIMPLAAWYSWGTNYSTIPSTAKLFIGVYWDDTSNEHLISQNDIWLRLPQITEKRWETVYASQNRCTLDAGHNIPLTVTVSGQGITNGLDYWAVWRKIHALADYTFTGNQRAKTVAFDDDFSGIWRNGGARPVRRLQMSSSPVVNTTSNPSYRYINRCSWADSSTPCP